MKNLPIRGAGKRKTENLSFLKRNRGAQDGFIGTIEENESVYAESCSEESDSPSDMNKSFSFALDPVNDALETELSESQPQDDKIDTLETIILRKKSQLQQETFTNELKVIKTSNDLVELSNHESSESSEAEEVNSNYNRQDFFEQLDSKSIDCTNFQSLNLSRPILKALTESKYTTPTPIQAQTIPVALLGKDIVASAVTGSGKTAAFVIPILERLLYKSKNEVFIRVLILCPTRELAAQCFNVTKNLAKYSHISVSLAAGGFNLKAQERELRLRPDIVIATPGRFIDLARNSQGVDCDKIEILVLDEADRMLQDGFSDEINEILLICPKSRQTMLFSATISENVEDLIRLSLKRPLRLKVDQDLETSTQLVQEFIRLRDQKEVLKTAILLYLCSDQQIDHGIIFIKDKQTTHRMKVIFALFNKSSAELHGDLSQEKRTENLARFTARKVNYLLATDLASRGLDIKGVDNVINYDSPNSIEIYFHRIGRTARAGRSGFAISLYNEKERKVMKTAMQIAWKQHLKKPTRLIDLNILEAIHVKFSKYEKIVDEILEEEKNLKLIEHSEMQLKKSQNFLEYKDDIISRPKRKWFKSKQKRIKT